MSRFSLVLLAAWAAKLGLAKDVYLKWDVTWVNAAPDGFERPVIGINDQWPCPQVDVDLGDRLIVDVYNGLGNQSTGVHWHGFHQYMSGVMDGTSEVTQCPIAPGQSMRYDFMVEQTGTYWYHSHNMAQYPDGFRGAFIVHDPAPPFQYDDEFTITLSDWYHDQMPGLLNQYLSQANGATGFEPIPDSALINDNSGTQIKVKPDTTYLVHIICISSWPGHAWVFDDHEMTVVEVDGVYTEPYVVGDKMLRVAPGQRMSVLIHTKSDASENFAIWDTMDINMMFIYENRPIPAGYNPNATAWLVYDETKPLPPPPSFNELIFVDDVELVPFDREPLLGPVDHQIIFETSAKEINGVPRFTINNETYLSQKVPSLYTAMTVGPELSSDPAVYGEVNPYVVRYGEVVEIIINNHHNNLHPWHLHGHQFQVLQRSAVDGGYFTGYFANVSETPVRRDTIMVQNHGHVVIRFRADNPGVWLLHCHVEWHVMGGLVATIIEAPETFPQSEMPIPTDHKHDCAAYPTPDFGNAAGNQGLNLTGDNTVVPIGSSGAMYSLEESPAPVPPPAPVVPEPEYAACSVPVQPPPPHVLHQHEPIVHSEDPKPLPNENNAYVQAGHVKIKTHDSGPMDGDEYLEQYEQL